MSALVLSSGFLDARSAFLVKTVKLKSRPEMWEKGKPF